MKKTTDVHQGALVLMVLKTLDVLGPLHNRVRFLERQRASTAVGRDGRWFNDGDQP